MKPARLSTVAIAICSISALAGCSGGSQNTIASLPVSPASRLQATHNVLPSGDDARLFTPQSLLLAPLGPPPKTRVEHELFVGTLSNYVVILKDKTYKEIGELTDGISKSDGVWVDNKGNVYVANVLIKGVDGNVVEYHEGDTSPSCIYTGTTDPINGTTDAHGNVYVVDFASFAVDEYAQCSNTIIKTFTLSNYVEGAAVDRSGDVFVSYAPGNFAEFVGGSTTPTQLGATVVSAAGLILDKEGNLIADDQNSGNIDVIAPPYSSARVLISDLSEPLHCSLNKRENLLFSANSGSSTVTVYSYPLGTLLTTLGSSNGITAAHGVGESPSAVF